MTNLFPESGKFERMTKHSRMAPTFLFTSPGSSSRYRTTEPGYHSALGLGSIDWGVFFVRRGYSEPWHRPACRPLQPRTQHLNICHLPNLDTTCHRLTVFLLFCFCPLHFPFSSLLFVDLDLAPRFCWLCWLQTVDTLADIALIIISNLECSRNRDNVL